MKLALIVAMSENLVIGHQGGLPWRLSADLRRFKKLTMGHHIIMGRKTYESIDRLLPGRTTIIVTRQPNYAVDGALIAGSLDEATQLATGDDEAFIIGGAEIYRQALPRVDRVYLTAVHTTIEGDTMFTEFDSTEWTEIENETHPADGKNEHEYSFHIYERVPAESCQPTKSST